MFTILTIVAIVSLCICDLAVLGLVASYVYTHSSHFHQVKSPDPIPDDSTMVPDESEELKQAKREYAAQEKAFQSMLNFNIEQAYGMNRNPVEELDE